MARIVEKRQNDVKIREPMNTYYTMLGVEPTASQDELTAAYQQQRDKYNIHALNEMDTEMQQVAAQRLAELDRAYAVLSDPAQRAAYDARIGIGAQPDHAPSARPAARRLAGRELWYTAGGVTVALLLIGVMWVLTGRDVLPATGEVNRPAPAFSLPTLDGSTVNLADYEGQVVLVNFWGTWCEPCRRETPALQSAYEELQAEGFAVIGVNLTDDELSMGNSTDDVQAFVDQFDVTYPIALDMDGSTLEAFRVYPLPTSFFVDAAGNIRYVRVGEITADEVSALFRQLRREAAMYEQ
jgi:peroxiredoxin